MATIPNNELLGEPTGLLEGCVSVCLTAVRRGRLADERGLMPAAS